MSAWRGQETESKGHVSEYEVCRWWTSLLLVR